MKSVICFCLVFMTVYTSDSDNTLISESSKVAESLKASPHFSPRKLTPSQRKRVAKESSYIIESTAEPSKRAVPSSPKIEQLERLHIKFDQRHLLAYNETTEIFRIIKDESELHQEESLHTCNPRLTEEEIRERFNIKA
jgi:hypothetical protein